MKNFFTIFCISITVFLAGFSHKPQIQWVEYTPKTMQAAIQSGQPAIFYFYAAWCGMCMRMKGGAFSDARVIEALEPFQRVKFDMSRRSPENDKINEVFEIDGFPTFVFYDVQGKEQMRIDGFRNADSFLKSINEFKKRFNITDPPKPVEAASNGN